jgi:Cu/Ag efflux pump CusA
MSTETAGSSEAGATNPAVEMVQSATALVETTSSVLNLCRTAIEMTRRRTQLQMMLASAVGCIIGMGIMAFVVVRPLHRDIAEWRAVAEKWHAVADHYRHGSDGSPPADTRT